MGENQEQHFQLSSNQFLRDGFQGSKVTSNGGSILVRKMDNPLGFGRLTEEHLTDSRASHARFSFVDLTRRLFASMLGRIDRSPLRMG